MLSFAEAARNPTLHGDEPARLARHGVSGLLIPATFEESFYRLNNLPERLSRLFSSIRPARIDEDALEPLTAQAQALIRTSYLLDDAAQQFHRALRAAALDHAPLHARRPGTLHAESAPHQPPGTHASGTAALHAVKRLWATDWSFDAVLERLDSAGSVGLNARPTLLLPGPPGRNDPTRAAQLGETTALVNEHGLTGLP
ncbi:hypothetical protein GCM10008959_15410 [Deinococcus seoulensis]|uniref:Uncharacterized protein n=2 Tax=Deinococcus TaxID=1298 RepID=A0ABQ2RPD2_9DEIO|nr:MULTISPECIES: hypothetical protein [Deinococcus]GGR54579.1 hypothetical protein GCM10008959_15410 [Deinococcus seoulensis]GGS33729.1 hypothetical protein GCM10008961_26890 [Deinococcus knuensis]